MVATQFDGLDYPRRFLIRPNCSVQWRDVVRFYAGIAVVSVGIAAGFAFKGAWLVLPFTGLEMLVLGAAFYVVSRRSADWQEVAIEGDSVLVTNSSAQRQGSALSFQRAWVRVELEDAMVKGHPSRLIMGSHGRHVEIGSCLNEKEKQALVVQLRRAVQLN